ncbi:MAG: lysophospholipid acyltransferase family protein [Deltaproteobacteria bacterium]|nr:lysophospholipid acyltransferase family protein [Deltaproteobacteria bacterium]
MRGFLYRVFVGASRWVGVWIVAAFAWVVSTGYFVFRRDRVRESLRFYGALFPDRGGAHAQRLAWRQFHAFASLFAERLRLRADEPFEVEEEGLEALGAAAREGRGAVLVMSHVGSWEIAARLLRRRGFRMMLHMGAREREQVERAQKADLRVDGVEVVVAGAGEGSAFDGVEGLRFLRGGGFVSLPADRPRAGESRIVDVRFAGRPARLSAAPWVLALVSGAPLFHFFSMRLGRRRYRFTAAGPVRLEVASRAAREEAIRRAAQCYADELEAVVRRHPEQWYSFERFLGDEEPPPSP